MASSGNLIELWLNLKYYSRIMTFNSFLKRALYLRQLQSKYMSIIFYLFSLQGVSILWIPFRISWTQSQSMLILPMFARQGSASRCRPRTWGRSTDGPRTPATSGRPRRRPGARGSQTCSACPGRGRGAPASLTTSAQMNSTDSGIRRRK